MANVNGDVVKGLNEHPYDERPTGRASDAGAVIIIVFVLSSVA